MFEANEVDFKSFLSEYLHFLKSTESLTGNLRSMLKRSGVLFKDVVDAEVQTLGFKADYSLKVETLRYLR